MQRTSYFSPAIVARDLLASLIVSLVALPLCLGIALASGAPLFSGIVAGIVGGIVVGLLSGSHTSVSGPAAGLTAIVAAQITILGSFEALLLAVMLAGLLQIGLGILRAGTLSAFFPSAVIKGLLAAIGVILIIKQIPYLLGCDMQSTGELPAHPHLFNDLSRIFTGDIHPGACVIGLFSLLLLILWDQFPRLKKSLVPAPLLVVLVGVGLAELFNNMGGTLAMTESARLQVQVPVAGNLTEFLGFLRFPDFSRILDTPVFLAGLTICLVASLETLLNLDAVDKIDKYQRVSPPNRELFAQGVGNLTCGLLGGLPLTSVIIRGSVNINAGARTKMSAVYHGCLLLISVLLLPRALNMIPLSCLAAILLMTGFKLASSRLVLQMWSEGRTQFLPFIITMLAIVMTDLLIGIGIGLGVSLAFILNSNLRRPIHRIYERHISGDVLHIVLANQVSFLNRAALEAALREVPQGGHVLLDARQTNYIDPDILALIREFRDLTAPVYEIQVSLRGFRKEYRLQDKILFRDYSTRELQQQLTPDQVLKLLQSGNERFVTGERLDRDWNQLRNHEATRQHPMAVILGGIDSRAPTELIFDLGLGDAYSVRVAGSVTGEHVYASLEYACVIGGAKLIVVMGHSRSSMVESAVRQACSPQQAASLTGCPSLAPTLQALQESITAEQCRDWENLSEEARLSLVNEVARRNVLRSVRKIIEESTPLRNLINQGQLGIIAAMLDVVSGRVEFLAEAAQGVQVTPSRQGE